MEDHFLDNLVDGNPEFRPEPWYNPHGDCVVYQVANEEVVADRVDDILTIYRSAVDNRPIGFQIKGVAALVRQFGWDGLACVSEENEDELLSVSVLSMLLAAYESRPPTMNRRRGYASAMSSPPSRGIPREQLPFAAMNN